MKIHAFKGRAIYEYDLLSNRPTEKKIADRDTPDFDEQITRYEAEGHEIRHPSDIPMSDAATWCEHARQEAERLGLIVAR